MSRFIALSGMFFISSVFVFADVEIVVTASRVNEDARSAPAYVRVISEDEIAQGNTVLDALKSLPDITLIASSPGREYIATGAFGENGFMRTLVMIDGRPINRSDMATVNWRTIPLDRVKRIEVVKGPLSSQYGDQAIAGAVNIIMKKPDGFESWIRGNITTDTSYRQGFGLAWGGRFFRAEGSVSLEMLNPVRDRSESTVVAADISAGVTLGNVDIDVKGTLSENHYQLPGGLTREQFESNPNQAVNPSDSVTERRYGAVLSAKADADQFNINSSVAWNRLKSTSDIASWGTWNDGVHDDIRGTLQSDVSLYVGDNVVLFPVLGSDVKWSQINLKTYEEVTRNTLKSDETPSRFDLGFWARTKALLGSSWTLDGGVRLSHYTVSMGSGSKDSLPFVFDVGLSFVPDDIWAVSMRYGRIFRYPALDEQASYSGYGASSFNEALKPEYGHHVMASTEVRLGRLQLQLAPYFIAMNDEIAYSADTYKNENIGSTYHYGTMASLGWSGDIFLAEVAYSFDEAQFVEMRKIVPLIPNHTVYGKVAVMPWKKLTFSTDGRFTSQYYEGGDNSNTLPRIPGRFEWNFRAEFQPMENLSLYGHIFNILDNRTPTSVYSGSWYPSVGRQFEVGMSARY